MSKRVNHRSLAEITRLKSHLYSLAILNIVLLPQEDDWLRLHKKIADPAHQMEIYQIDNGGGDHLYLVFSEDGCIIKGFDHESDYSPHAREVFAVWPGIYDEVPADLLRLLDDPMFEKEAVTFCLWRKADEAGWSKGTASKPDNDADDGMSYLFEYLYPTPEDFCQWAADYLELEIPLPPVQRIYNGEPCTMELIGQLNPERDGSAALKEIQELVEG